MPLSAGPTLGRKQAPVPTLTRMSQALSLGGWVEVKWGGPSYCKTWHLQLQHTRDGGDRWAWGQSTKEPLWVV